MKLFFLLVCGCFLILKPGIAQDNSAKFVLVRQDPPIYIYERWITFPESQPPQEAREVKCEFTIEGSIYKMLDLLKDESKIRIWQTHVSKFKYYAQPDTTFWLEYSYHDIPWPVSDQDHFLEYHVSEKKPGKELFVTFKSRPDQLLAPKNKGVTRMILSGSWTMEQLAPGKVKVTYRILSMPVGIPRIFTDPVIRANLMSTIKSLMTLTVEKK